MANLYDTYGKDLYKLGSAPSAGSVLTDTSEIDPTNIGGGSLVTEVTQEVGNIASGKSTFDNSVAGYILGTDQGVAKFYIGNTTDYLNWNGTSLTVTGALMVSSIDIGGSDATSMHVDVDGNTWWGAATYAAAPAKVSNAGAATFTSITISGYAVSTKGIFGGDGSDGALAISSGTTTINLGNAKVVTKNYTSISVTGTGKLAFSNPHASGTIIILKSQGNVVLTSSTNPNIDAGGMGAAGGAGVAALGGDGSTGTTATPLTDTASHAGEGGTAGGGGAGGTQYANSGLYTITNGHYRSFGLFLACGSGGGGGNDDGTNDGKAGGAGGAALVVECAGDINITGNINATGAAGTSASGGAGGGGGGSGGTCIVLYNSSTAQSGTISDAGGAGGNGGGSASGGGGGGGIGGAGGNKGTGGNVGKGGGGAGGGGAGASGDAGGTAGAASTSSDHYIQV